MGTGMLALVFDGKARLKKDYPQPRPTHLEALVAVTRAGVCRTDIEILKGYMEFKGVLGHEFVGMVVEGPKKWKGKRVVADITAPCRHCDMCKSQLPKHCRERKTLGISGMDGAFAEFLKVPVDNLHEIPSGVTEDEAVFAEPLAAALQVAEQAQILPTSRMAVLGDGRLGLLTSMALRQRPAEMLLVGKHQDKLDLAARSGVWCISVGDFKPQKDFDIVVDTTGDAEGFKLAMAAVRPRGVIVLKSTAQAGGELNLSSLVVDEVTVVGSRCGPLDKALELLASKTLDVASLITSRFPLKDGLKALAAAQETASVKVLIDVAPGEAPGEALK
jgi:threonine dehydrogenase-like Zn-dependent dehydrogenase